MIYQACQAATLHQSSRRTGRELHDNTALLDELLKYPCINAGSKSPIRGIMIGDEFAAIDAAKTLQEYNYAVTVAMYPTVKMGHAMLRLAVSASHSNDDIRGVASVINTIMDYQNRRARD